jgi:uncharacterized protein (DUF433 family)
MGMMIQELESQVHSWTPQEKARVFTLLAPDPSYVWPGVQRTPGVCGGDARIAGTRITISLLEGWRRLGLTDSQILQSYPHLTHDDLSNAWTYVVAHMGEIERQIRQNEQA